jgi:hypothetical protein
MHKKRNVSFVVFVSVNFFFTSLFADVKKFYMKEIDLKEVKQEELKQRKKTKKYKKDMLTC